MFIYSRPSDRVTGTCAVESGTVDSQYPPDYLMDGHPEKPAKLTTNDGAWVATLTAATRIDWAVIVHHNFATTATVRLQGHTANSWASPTLDVVITIPAAYPDRFPVNVWVDLKTLFPLATNRTFQYWRLAVSANTAPLFVGEWLLLATYRDLGIRNISWGSQRALLRPAILHETDLLVRHTYDYGTTVRRVEVDLEPTTATVTEIDQWWRDAQGIVRPFVIVPAKDESDAWMVTFGEPEMPYTREKLNYHNMSLAFQELSRGLYP
jgi:hypothetical protein